MDLGGFDSLLHGHDRTRAITLQFELDLQDRDLPEYLMEGEYWLLESVPGGGHLPDTWLSRVNTISFALTLRWSELRGAPMVESVDITANGERLARIEASQDARNVSIKYLDMLHPVFWDPDATEESPVSWFEDLMADSLHEARYGQWPHVDLPLGGQLDALPMSGRPLQVDVAVWGEGNGIAQSHPLAYRLLITSVLSGLIVGPVDLIRQELEKLVYIGPLREVPSRHPRYIRSPDASRWVRGSAAWDLLHSASRSFLDNLNDWLNGRGKLNTGYIVEAHRYRELPDDHPISLAISQGLVLDEDDLRSQLNALTVKSRIALRESSTGLEVLPQDIGVGVSQVLPVVVAALYQRSGILAIEQPELHVHPALQVTLGDLFAAAVGSTDVLYLLETHSEHLMLRFLRRIRETATDELPPGAPSLTPAQILVYYVQNTDHGMKLAPLRISEEGEFIDRWPAGFFEERVEELF